SRRPNPKDRLGSGTDLSMASVEFSSAPQADLHRHLISSASRTRVEKFRALALDPNTVWLDDLIERLPKRRRGGQACPPTCSRSHTRRWFRPRAKRSLHRDNAGWTLLSNG